MATDPVELAHWRAVAAKPSDEAPRWEYLKYLKLKGNEERARFTQLQLDAAFCQPWDFLALEAANFRGAYFSQWGPLQPPIDMHPHRLLGETRTDSYETTRWEGGFPSELTINHLEKAAPLIPELATAAPITRLELGEARFFARRPATGDERATIAALLEHFEVDAESDEGSRLIDSIVPGTTLSLEDDLGQLIAWTNRHRRILVALLDQPWFKRIRHLALATENRLICELLDGVSLDHLTGLSIGGWTTFNDKGPIDSSANAFAKLFPRPLMKNLRALALTGDAAQIEPELGALDRLPALQQLSLHTWQTGPGLLSLLDHAPDLRRLELHYWGWGPTLAGWSGLEKLEELVAFNSTAADLRAVMATNKLERVRSLRIDQLRDCTADDFSFIFASLNKLQRLSIRRTQVGDAGLDALMASHAFPQLLALEIDNCRITDDAVFRLAKTIHLPKLRWLRLAPFSLQLTEQSLFAVQQRFQPANKMAFDY